MQLIRLYPKNFLVWIYVFVSIIIFSCSTEISLDQKPDTLFILDDDHGYEKLSCFSGLNTLTPNFVKMVIKGVLFTSTYGSAACTTTCMSLYTSSHVPWHNYFIAGESRRILGEYKLSFDDYIIRSKFPDQIGVFNKFTHIHPNKTTAKEYVQFLQEKDKSTKLKDGECLGTPYSILAPKGWQNLRVTGLCTSSDLVVHGYIRVQSAASIMRHAVDDAAVQSIKTGQPANDLDTRQLITILREWDTNLPQNTLSREMTRV